jgi:hypothetical protein
MKTRELISTILDTDHAYLEDAVKCIDSVTLMNIVRILQSELDDRGWHFDECIRPYLES